MTLPSSEDDLKIRARRRLIGAVALTLLAVILLPLLLEDEPPPAGPLAVRMTNPPDSVPPAEQGREDPPVVAPQPSPPQPAARPESRLVQPPAAAKPAPKPDPVKPKPQASSPKPAPKPTPKLAPKPTPPAKASASSEAFVVQLAALSDADKALQLQARAAKAGLPAYSDKAGLLTRVRVGPYATREAAVAAAVKLAENGMTGQVLLAQ